MLRELGYEVGSGVMIGIPGQSYDDLAGDLELFRELNLDMIGVGPFLMHPETPLADPQQQPVAPPGEQAPASELMTYKVIALTRLLCPRANIPSTTALATLNRRNGRELGLVRGANIVMPNLTPPKYRIHYEIYPNKACIQESARHVSPLHGCPHREYRPHAWQRPGRLAKLSPQPYTDDLSWTRMMPMNCHLRPTSSSAKARSTLSMRPEFHASAPAPDRASGFRGDRQEHGQGGLSLADTAVLLAADDEESCQQIFEAARQLKRDVYGNRIVLFAPLYVGSSCKNDCLYCAFRRSNPDVVRRTLSQDDLRAQVEALERKGHKRTILVFGEHPV